MVGGKDVEGTFDFIPDKLIGIPEDEILRHVLVVRDHKLLDLLGFGVQHVEAGSAKLEAEDKLFAFEVGNHVAHLLLQGRIEGVHDLLHFNCFL